MVTSSEAQSWQQDLNLQLVQRLLRPVAQPGVVNLHMAQRLMARSQHSSQTLPLLNHLMQKQTPRSQLQTNNVPIVYAQRLPSEPVQNSPKSQSVPQTSKPVVIQAKFAASSTSTVPAELRSVQGGQEPRSHPQANLSFGNVQQIIPSQPVNSSFSEVSHSASTPEFIKVTSSKVAQALAHPNLQLPLVQAKIPPDFVAIGPKTKLEKTSVPVVLPASVRSQNQPQLNLNLQQQSVPVRPQSQDQSAPNFSEHPRSKLVVFPKADPHHLETVENLAPFITQLNQQNSREINASVSNASTLNNIALVIAKTNNSKTTVNHQNTNLIYAQSIASHVNHARAETNQSTKNVTNNNTNHLSVEEQALFNSQIQQTTIAKKETQPQINLDDLANQVERKLMRRLSVERERRGWKS